MIKKCSFCNKKYYEDVSNCIFCFSELDVLKEPEDLKIRSFTKVNIPSKNHDNTPYYCILAEDEEGNLFLSKSNNLPKENERLNVATENNGLNLKVGIIGTGKMGISIAALFLAKGVVTVLISRNEEKLKMVKDELSNRLSKNYNGQEKESLLKKLVLSANYNELYIADLIIESVKEDLAVKKEVFSQLDKVCSKKVIIVSNTSCLPVTQLAEIISNPSRIAGLHFSNPADKMLFAEIIKTKYTSNETIEYLTKLTVELGKKPIISDDTPGFIANRVLFPYLIEAIKLYEKGVSKEDIDNGVKYAYNHPLGPLKVIDLMGLDTFYLIANYLYEATGEQQFKVPETFKKMIQANHLGCKTGEGFYKYK